MNDPIGRQIQEVLKDRSLSTVAKRAVLRDHLKLSKESIEELCPLETIVFNDRHISPEDSKFLRDMQKSKKE